MGVPALARSYAPGFDLLDCAEQSEIILEGDELLDQIAAASKWKDAELVIYRAARASRNCCRSEQGPSGSIDGQVVLLPRLIRLNAQKLVKIVPRDVDAGDLRDFGALQSVPDPEWIMFHLGNQDIGK